MPNSISPLSSYKKYCDSNDEIFKTRKKKNPYFLAKAKRKKPPTPHSHFQVFGDTTPWANKTLEDNDLTSYLRHSKGGYEGHSARPSFLDRFDLM